MKLAAIRNMLPACRRASRGAIGDRRRSFARGRRPWHETGEQRRESCKSAGGLGKEDAPDRGGIPPTFFDGGDKLFTASEQVSTRVL